MFVDLWCCALQEDLERELLMVLMDHGSWVYTSCVWLGVGGVGFAPEVRLRPSNPNPALLRRC